MNKYFQVIILMCCLVITSCSKDQIPQDIPNDRINGAEQRVQLTLNLPASQISAPNTYAINADDENQIISVDVLAFRVSGTQELFMYRKQAKMLNSSGSSSQAKFYADLLKGTDGFRFVVLCNSSQELTNSSATLTLNRPKAEVLAAIVKMQTAKWNAVSSGNFNPFPMWGESAVIKGIGAATENMSFNLLRSVAAIDVNLSGTALKDFLITSVSLFNSNDRGMIAPVAANYNATNKKVTQPSLVSAAKALATQDYLLKSPAANFKNEIYLFESAAPATTNTAAATGLVIGGHYKGSAVTTYYRVDMVNSSGAPIAILRNYRYTINISSVISAGLPDKVQAWNSKRVNMSVAVNSWNEANLPVISIPEAYDLTLSQTAIQDDGGRKRLALNLGTAYSGGWTITSGSNWITVPSASGPSGNNQSVSFNVTGNTTNAVRTGTLTVKAGKFSKTVKVTQAVPNFKDNIPGLNFYIANADLPGTPNWYLAANVANNFNATTDPMVSQVNPARAGSCAQVYGPGWRLPNLTEVELIMDKKDLIGGFSYDYYWVSTDYSFVKGGTSAYARYSTLRGGASGLILTGHKKSTTTNRTRCVKDIPL